MGDGKKRRYSWYKHHAWAALALLSIFLVINGLYPEVPTYLKYPIVAFLCTYAIVAILFTYRHNRENISIGGEQGLIERHDALEKDILKIEKKRLKAEAKKAKKS